MGMEHSLHLFLALVGPDAYNILTSCAYPKAPEDHTLKELLEMLANHFVPSRLKHAEHHRFWKNMQLEGESITAYVSRIRKLATTCEFAGDSLEANLLDAFILGLRDTGTVRKFLLEENLTLDRAVKIARETDMASAEAQTITSARTEFLTPINFKQRLSGAPLARVVHTGESRIASDVPHTPCPSCGATHWRIDCPHRQAVCNHCQKTGHIAKVCKQKHSGQSKKRKRSHNNQKRKKTQANVIFEKNPKHHSIQNVIMLIYLSLGAVCTVFTWIVIILYRHTAVVKASDFMLSQMFLLGILMCMSTAVSFAAPVSMLNCSVGFIWFCTSVVFIVSIIFVKTNRVSRVFESGFVKSFKTRVYLSYQGPAILVVFLTVIQIAICFIANYFDPIQVNRLVISEDIVYLQCRSNTRIGYAIAVGYFSVLCICCVYWAFKTRKLPENFCEAKYINFTSLIILMSLLTMVPSYFGTAGPIQAAISSF
ncbi:Extracellular calcium-sensing receptor, partial [Trichoplax sp. H2]